MSFSLKEEHCTRFLHAAELMLLISSRDTAKQVWRSDSELLMRFIRTINFCWTNLNEESRDEVFKALADQLDEIPWEVEVIVDPTKPEKAGMYNWNPTPEEIAEAEEETRLAAKRLGSASGIRIQD